MPRPQGVRRPSCHGEFKVLLFPRGFQTARQDLRLKLVQSLPFLNAVPSFIL